MARKLWLESYSITLGWLDAAKPDGQGGYRAVTAKVHRVEGDPKLYRSETFQLTRPVKGPATAQPQDGEGPRVLDPAPGATLYAVVGNQLALDFAAAADAGTPKRLPLGAAFVIALLLAAWLAFRFLTNKRAAPVQALPRIPNFKARAADAETTRLQSAPAFSASGRQGGGRQQTPTAEPNQSPAFQVRAKRGESYTTVRLERAGG